ncbi:hypothetical protein [Bosea sp. (in: a-proteobacteria)]|uniref:virion core protein, T7 gp14 family n=1 Tax=Bosea sp. (in: a-proteobacteria) TaxID=1871050 RepID=UPI001AC82C43|nr:hypothetical protein [Bosea sp. (in: a-proteobacteria)]MBN9442313.1 hypothetical protein [Bosea sp. (in: a-proteobacteria)]
MCVAAAAAVISTGASIAGQIIGFGAQNKQAWEQRAYNAKVEAQQEKYRAELIEYQNVVYQQEVDYGKKTLDYQRSEFQRQDKVVTNARESIQKNLFAQYATLLQRAVEENMATTFQSVSNQKSVLAAQAKGQVSADARGVEGNSVEQLINDVAREGGDNETILQLNRSATARQLNLEAMGLKASADQQLYNLPIQTFQPIAPLNPPQPVSPVTPAAPVAGPNRGAMMANVVGAVTTGMSNYASWSGQSVKQAFSFK